MALFLSPKEVAARWNCSARHVRRLCAGGELPAMRLGASSWRISVSAVEAYEAAQQTGAPKTDATRKVAMRHEKSQAAPGAFELPAGYVPRFPALWGMSPEEVKARR